MGPADTTQVGVVVGGRGAADTTRVGVVVGGGAQLLRLRCGQSRAPTNHPSPVDLHVTWKLASMETS